MLSGIKKCSVTFYFPAKKLKVSEKLGFMDISTCQPLNEYTHTHTQACISAHMCTQWRGNVLHGCNDMKVSLQADIYMCVHTYVQMHIHLHVYIQISL